MSALAASMTPGRSSLAASMTPGRSSLAASMTEPLFEALSADPVETIALLAGLLVITVVAAVGLRRLDRHLRSLRHQVLAVTLVALGVGAAAALGLTQMMVLDDAQLRNVVAVLAVTAVFAVVLVFIASAPLGRDSRRLERAVRLIDDGDREARTGVDRADELGEVARAVDHMVERLGTLERERANYEAERSALLSSISHDLRTPLAAMRAALEAITDGVAPDPERYVRSMRNDVDALTNMVDDLFLLTRMDAGRLDLVSEVVDLSELADEAVESLAPVAARRHIELDVRASQRLSVVGNPAALGRVVRNLVDNAIRHAPERSTVTVAVADEQSPTVRVIDEGEGFPSEFTDTAFERFTRADASRGRTTGGSGLGLAIAQGLVEAHGGRIWIEDPPGGRVAFSIPAA